MSESWDVVVVGGGNAGFCAAQSAREHGARVLLLEKAPREWAGGNSYFTAGAMRTVHNGLDDVAGIIEPPATDRIDLDPYPESEFLGDLRRVTEGRCDPRLAEILVGESRATMGWLHELGLRFELMFHRQAYEVDGRFRFWGGLAVGAVGGGKGMIADHLRAAAERDVVVRFDAHVTGLLTGDAGDVRGVRLAGGERIEARSVVLASGGFEANPAMRSAYLGPGWDLALVRGTPYNTGDGITMALAAGAQPFGNFSGCHSVAWDAGAGTIGDRDLTNQLTRGGYPFGIIVNAEGKRFVDEGADFRNYTYAKYGARILREPGGRAVQVFDAKAMDLLRPEEYQAPGVTKVESDTLDGLAKELGIDQGGLVRTVEEFNRAVTGERFNPTVKDGKHTEGISPAKSNWAQPLDTPPYVAFPVTCGITFTFGGLRIDEGGAVLDTAGRTVPGLFAAGELVGGLFFFNYPGGSGLTAGSVFGRRAGRSAAA
ncbi:FAD-dependent tricarballylate dehydrogenase TcuA [Amycolatopsis acidiphila]|uniref:FAD-binding dehydrogenase n=1 Tax=Amycolatopsis acidiphila TaxID=715473 RepID=A0A558AFB2_9PSEU|nr:FAD-dependent tricarballylate dehydrogenase TcuA [Amycolatopsis acidiphila]TVT22957.1 FAD-binding dehydrogenase [Amycolatopsis acidiphila]UIJ57118.1 FAD-dependent tricarballylate dehydrogenase TcuA [Amycolatopsis acidiphila]GHG53264.1 tricarballylate dehydrogenase [Amycolatopsis acidiphila]